MTKIQFYREQQGMTVAELAKKTKLSIQNIKDAENCYEMYISETNKIAKVLKVRPSTIRVINSEGCYAREKRR